MMKITLLPESKSANNRGYWVLNLKDGSGAAINVYGGTFINYDPSSSMTEKQRRNCAAIDKDKASPSNDNFLITVRFPGSFVPLVTVLFVVERG